MDSIKIPIKLETKKDPLPLETVAKLKVFAIYSIKKDLIPQLPKDVMHLAVSVAYEFPSALMSVAEIMRTIGINPELYKIGFMAVGKELDKIVQMPAGIKLDVKIPNKSKEEMSNYVKYVFDKVGLKEEKEVANLVLRRFNANN